MTQEEKQLLLKDLCTRLPYGVKVLDNSHKSYGVSKLINIGADGSMLVDNEVNDIQYYPIIDETKPYLRPMSSMTEEEKGEVSILLNYEFYIDDDYALVAEDDRHRIRLDLMQVYIDWLNAHHFDYCGLIEKGLAIEAPEGMYNIN